MCNITINYPYPKEPGIAQLRERVIAEGGTFNGDATSGNFSVKGFAVNYQIQHDTISITVTKKPFFISCRTIERKLREYIDNLHY